MTQTGQTSGGCITYPVQKDQVQPGVQRISASDLSRFAASSEKRNKNAEEEEEEEEKRIALIKSKTTLTWQVGNKPKKNTSPHQTKLIMVLHLHGGCSGSDFQSLLREVLKRRNRMAS